MTLALIPGLADAKNTTGAGVEHFTLTNGLELVVIPDRRAPVVTHMVWYRVGGADEPRGKSGIAHFLEHLMFKGTEACPGGFSKIVSELGGQENAFTSHDFTAYYQRIAPQHLGRLMGFEADRMTGLALTDAVVDPERSVVLEERKMRVDNNPAALLGEEIGASLFSHHPYGIPIIGWHDEIVGLTRHDAIDFHNRYYTPNNAVVVVAGDVSAPAVRDLAEKHYGAVSRRAEPPQRLRPKEPGQRAERRVTLSDERVDQPILQRYWRVPSYRLAAAGEAEALELLGQILGGGATSRLYRGLVADRKIAASVGAWYGGSALDESRFGFWTVPVHGQSLDGNADAAAAIIGAIATQGVSEGELERAKTRLIADAVYARDSQSTLARSFGEALMVGGTVETLQTWPARVAAVPPEALQDVAARLLAEKPGVTACLQGV